MDAVVAVDTACANLAGAMGKRLLVMVECENDFRWGATGERTRWYPTATVYRQTHAGEWRGVVARVAAELSR